MYDKARAFSAVIGIAILLSACGGSQVTVQVLQEGGESGVQPVADLPVQFVPFDRDALFARMAASAAEPEPQISADLQTALDSVLVLQAQWRTAETEWSEVRDELRQLSDRLQGMDQRSREYRELYDSFGGMERRERNLDQQRTSAFDAFTALQDVTATRLDSMRAVKESWEEIAFQDYETIVDSILAARGAEILEDTTGVDGTVTRALGGGDWWVHTRIPIPAGELYWNLLIDPSASDTLRLTAQNGEQRLRF
jgi:hypothetical protein